MRNPIAWRPRIARYAHRLAPGLLLGVVLGLTACGPEPSREARRPVDTSSSDALLVEETFLTEITKQDDIDSPAVWHGPNGQHWLLATAKATDQIVVYDAATGATLQRIGRPGEDPGEFKRPNGILVVEDLLLVVERDNHRIQVLRLPSFTPLGFIGATTLKRPYGTASASDGDGHYTVYVTDDHDYEAGEGRSYSLVQQFTFSVEGDALHSRHVRSIGDTIGHGVLKDVETIYVDPEHDALLLAEESHPPHIKRYTLDAGYFTGQRIGLNLFRHEVEGFTIYACDRGEGYLVVTDQSECENTFHIFDRATLAHLGTFAGQATRNTDGVALTQRRFGSFASGAFYAVHDDAGVNAFAWADIANALGLRSDCTAAP